MRGAAGEKAPLYATDQTVADFDLLRQALGVSKMTVDGVSYGSFTAARYAVAHPHNVARLVLDSVLPHKLSAGDSLYLTGLTAEARVLRTACAESPACGYDPADDLAWVVRHRGTADGVRIFDTIVTYEFLDPSYRNPNPQFLPPGSGDIVGALHSARLGDSAKLDTVLDYLKPGGDDPAEFSSGLHAATLCADGRFPWAPRRPRPRSGSRCSTRPSARCPSARPGRTPPRSR
jgi:pimeloyl-ACP methyl ester carboxylesterase